MGHAGLMIAAALLVGGLPAAPARAQSQPQVISIGSGSPVGVYFVAGNAICRAIGTQAAGVRGEGRAHPLRCTAPATAGSYDNLAQIAAGDLTVGIVQSDSHYHAFRGDTPNDIRPNDNLRSVMALYIEPVQLVVGKDSNINSVDDLKGQRVNLGNVGSGSRATMHMLLAAHGFTETDLKAAGDLPPQAQSTALCDGKIDAFGYVVGIPSSSVALATDGCDARLLPLNGAVETKLIKDNPYYVAVRIPKGTYRTADRDIASFGTIATLVTSAGTDEAVVYEVTKAVMENLDEIRATHPALASLVPMHMISDGLTAPLHPGALRYYRQRGWLPAAR